MKKYTTNHTAAHYFRNRFGWGNAWYDRIARRSYSAGEMREALRELKVRNSELYRYILLLMMRGDYARDLSKVFPGRRFDGAKIDLAIRQILRDQEAELIG